MWNGVSKTEYSSWKVYQNIHLMSEDWKSVGFDDVWWSEMKAVDIPNFSDSATTYICKTVAIESLEEYEVLNVCVRYGGVVVYLNGKMVVRLNVYEEVSLETESIVPHDPTAFSKFHIIVVGSGAMEEKNVIAFEIHRPVGWWWLREFVFDLSGVF